MTNQIDSLKLILENKKKMHIQDAVTIYKSMVINAIKGVYKTDDSGEYIVVELDNDKSNQAEINKLYNKVDFLNTYRFKIQTDKYSRNIGMMKMYEVVSEDDYENMYIKVYYNELFLDLLKSVNSYYSKEEVENAFELNHIGSVDFYEKIKTLVPEVYKEGKDLESGWFIEIDELRDILNVSGYESTAEFNRKIVVPIIDDVSEAFKLKINYFQNRENRKTVSYEFYLK